MFGSTKLLPTSPKKCNFWIILWIRVNADEQFFQISYASGIVKETWIYDRACPSASWYILTGGTCTALEEKSTTLHGVMPTRTGHRKRNRAKSTSNNNLCMSQLMRDEDGYAKLCITVCTRGSGYAQKGSPSGNSTSVNLEIGCFQEL